MEKVYVILISNTVWSYSKDEEELALSFLNLRNKAPTLYKLYKDTIKILVFDRPDDITRLFCNHIGGFYGKERGKK